MIYFKMKVKLAHGQCPKCLTQLVGNMHGQLWCPNTGGTDTPFCSYGNGMILKQDKN